MVDRRARERQAPALNGHRLLVSASMKEPRDAYKVLQVDPEADDEVIQAAYRRLAQKYHPDVSSSGIGADAAEARMVEINAAWDILRDPARRAAYDRTRARAASQAQAAGAGARGEGDGRHPPTA